jgi:enoyl-CoA hydratase
VIVGATRADVIEADEREGILYLEVPTPARSTAESSELARELREWCQTLAERDELLQGVVLRAGGDAFCVSPPASAEDCDRSGVEWAAATAAMARTEAPTVAVLTRDAVGPGWELALACDLRVAALDVRVGSPEVRFGRMPAAGGTQRLARLLGPGRALRLLLLGEIVAAPEALDLGLVHRVAAPDELAAVVDEVVAALRASAPIALSYAKEVLRSGQDLSLQDGLRLEADLAELLQTTDDRREGIGAFLARRPARFEGR